MKKILSFVTAILLTGQSLSALTVTRFVSPTGTGDGMTEQNPTSDLGSVLAIGAKVDLLELKVAPGFYSLNLPDTGEGVAFSNIVLDGTWHQEGSSDKVRINYPGIEFINSQITNVSFSGSVSVNGGALVNCDADRIMTLDLNGGNGMLKKCNAKGFQITNWAHRSNTEAQLISCNTTGNGGYGLSGKNIGTLAVIDCNFNNNAEGGVNIDGCKRARFENCQFNYNSGDGALRFVEFDNSGIVYFDKCTFLYNKVTSNHCYNIYVYSNASFRDCLFVGNTEKDYDRKGIVHLVRPDFNVVNCTFIDNKGALELESFYPSRYQISNCAFWNNGPTNVYTDAREDVPLERCAMDHGTGVPELDAQKGIIRLTAENKGFEFTGTEVVLQPNSILVNNGENRSILDKDIFYHPRNAFGGTDIGCVEYVTGEGLWKPDSMTVSTYDCNYYLAKATVGSNDYYCLFPEDRKESGDYNIQSYFTDFIYLDKMPVKPKTHFKNIMIERHTGTNGGYLVDVLAYLPERGDGPWVTLTAEGYSSIKERPVVKVVDGDIKFIKPQKVTPKKSTKKVGKTGSKPLPSRRKRSAGR